MNNSLRLFLRNIVRIIASSISSELTPFDKLPVCFVCRGPSDFGESEFKFELVENDILIAEIYEMC